VKSPVDVLQDYAATASFPVNINVAISASSVDFQFCLFRLSSTAEAAEDNCTVINLTSSAMEQICQESVWICSQYIRQYMYGLLGCEQVQEIIREKDSAEWVKTPVTAKRLCPHAAINEAVKWPLQEREGMILTILKCKKMSESSWSELLCLPPELKLPVAAAFYWYKTSAVDLRLVKALLFCFRNSHPLPIKERQYSEQDVHVFCEWQCVYRDVLALDYMLNSPFKPTSPAMLFSSKIALFCASWDSMDDQFDRDSLRTSMLAIVTSTRKKARKNPAPAAASSPLKDRNPFAMLSNLKD